MGRGGGRWGASGTHTNSLIELHGASGPQAPYKPLASLFLEGRWQPGPQAWRCCSGGGGRLWPRGPQAPAELIHYIYFCNASRPKAQ